MSEGEPSCIPFSPVSLTSVIAQRCCSVWVFAPRRWRKRGEQPSAISRAPRCGWFTMAPAFVACANTARLKSPYILIFRPLRVDPFLPFISHCLVFGSPLPPPNPIISYFSLHSPARLYLLCHFLFLSSLWFFWFLFPPSPPSILSWLYHQLRRAVTAIVSSSQMHP